MDEDLHNIEDLFHSQLNDNEILPPEKTWNEIDVQLDKDNLVSIKKKYNYLKKIAVLLFLLLSCFTIFEITKMHKNNYSVKDDFVVKTEKDLTTENKINRNNDLNKKGKVNTITQINSTPKADIDKTLSKVNSNGNSISRTTLKNNNRFIDKNTAQNKEPETKLTYDSPIKNKFISKTLLKANIQPTSTSFKDEFLTKTNNEKQILLLRKNTAKEFLLPTTVFNVDLQKKILQKKNIDVTINNIASTKEKKDKKQQLSKFSLTPFFSSDIAWYRLQNDKQGTNIENAVEIDKEEKAGFSSTYGVVAEYKTNRHWAIQSGITIFNSKITTDPKQIYAQPDGKGNIKYRINTSSGYGYVLPSFSANPLTGDSLYAFTSIHQLQYVSIPVAVVYNVPKGKLNFKALLGVSANILAKAKIETTVEKGFNNELETVDNIQGLKKVYFSGLAGVGIDYKLNNKLAATFIPTLRYALNSINKEAAVKSYPVTLGFNLGLKISL